MPKKHIGIDNYFLLKTDALWQTGTSPKPDRLRLVSASLYFIPPTTGVHHGKKISTSEVVEISWLPKVEEHDYPAAESYLLIIYGQDRVSEIVATLRNAPTVQFKAKDIFQASQLSLLGVGNAHVEKDRAKILAGESLSPLLLVRDSHNSKVLIADGYHRLCAIYGFNEDALIHCKIV